MGYLFITLGTIAGLLWLLLTSYAVMPDGTTMHVLIGAVYGLIAAVLWVGAWIIFRMDDHHSKKDTPK